MNGFLMTRRSQVRCGVVAVFVPFVLYFLVVRGHVRLLKVDVDTRVTTLLVAVSLTASSRTALISTRAALEKTIASKAADHGELQVLVGEATRAMEGGCGWTPPRFWMRWLPRPTFCQRSFQPDPSRSPF